MGRVLMSTLQILTIIYISFNFGFAYRCGSRYQCSCHTASWIIDCSRMGLRRIPLFTEFETSHFKKLFMDYNNVDNLNITQFKKAYWPELILLSIRGNVMMNCTSLLSTYHVEIIIVLSSGICRPNRNDYVTLGTTDFTTKNWSCHGKCGYKAEPVSLTRQLCRFIISTLAIVIFVISLIFCITFYCVKRAVYCAGRGITQSGESFLGLGDSSEDTSNSSVDIELDETSPDPPIASRTRSRDSSL